jgi:hypothetical protein
MTIIKSISRSELINPKPYLRNPDILTQNSQPSEHAIEGLPLLQVE